MYKNEHKFPYRWTKKDANFTKDKGKVMSCFCCGGGSSFGYKLAGYDVVACNEIDPKVMKMYLKNHDVKYAFNCDIRELITNINMGGHIMKEELHNLDILDASFPCSVFSIAGDRQKAWGKEKVFREGQKAQRLDDLAFYSIDLAKELKPKVVVFENVQGLLQGEAIEYVKEIYRQMNDAGYILQHWLLNARNMGVPQNRPRVFFIGLRKDLCEPFMVQKDLFERVPKIDMDFNEKEISCLQSALDKGHLTKEEFDKRVANEKNTLGLRLIPLYLYPSLPIGITLTSIGGEERVFDGSNIIMILDLDALHGVLNRKKNN